MFVPSVDLKEKYGTMYLIKYVRCVYLKRFKKAMALILCVIFVLSAFSSVVFATSINEGIGTIVNKDFTKGYGPSTNGYKLEYGYFAPTNDSWGDNVKHPLVVFTSGTGGNNSVDAEWKANPFPRWASDEYQARFASGGSYLLFVRAPEPAEWNLNALIKPLKATVDDFCKNHPNVDTSKIYYVGWCLGAAATWRILGKYPNEVAGIIACSAFYAPTSAEIQAASDKAVWLLGCTKDTTALYNLYTGSTWNSLKKAAKDKSKIRLTKYSSSYSSDKTNHEMWVDACYDMFYSGLNGTTTDGNGNIIELKTPEQDGMIQWLSQFEVSPSESKCNCACHSSGITKLFWKLFGINGERQCKCGASHW